MAFEADPASRITHDPARGWRLRHDASGGAGARYFAIVGDGFACRFECRLLYRDANMAEMRRNIDALRTGVWVIDRIEGRIPGLGRAATLAAVVEAMTAYGINHMTSDRQTIVARPAITLDGDRRPLFAQWQGFLTELLRRREAEMPPSARIQAAAARCTGDEAELDEIRLDDLFDRVARLGQASRQSLDANRPAAIDFGDHGKVAAVHGVQPKPVDIKAGQRRVSDFPIDDLAAGDMREVPHAAQ